MNKKWNERTTAEKVSTVISMIAVCAWLIFEILDRNQTVSWAGLASSIAILVVCVCEAIAYRNEEKRWIFYIAVGGAVLMLAIIALTLM